ncbi:MAG: competence/damage-inducible protein A [Gemmatimonadaceae bacterium]
MNVEVVTIGDELLLGFTVDTNAAHLARELAAAGIGVARRSTVGDAPDEIAKAVREALDRTGAVITTGGLGPTSDDLTKPSIAALFGRAMKFDETIWEDLKVRWQKYRWTGTIPESNKQQAMIPEGAVILVNRHGSAPGIWLEEARPSGQRWVAMLPGVPREMRGMLADELMPRLRARATGTPVVVASRTLRTIGIGESALADLLGPLAKGPPGLPLAYLPSVEGTDLRLTTRDSNSAEAERRLDAGAAELRAVLGAYVYGEGKTDLAEVVLDLLRARGLKIAVAESCTGGMLGARITAIAGSSDCMIGGVIAYADAVKENQLGVRPETLAARGAVSEETAREMAAGVRERFGAQVGVSITGIAGPGGGTPEKPVGTVCMAVSAGPSIRAVKVQMLGDRDEIRRRSAQAALNLVRRVLTETP